MNLDRNQGVAADRETEAEVREDEEDEGIKVVDTLAPLPDWEMTLKLLIHSPSLHPSFLLSSHSCSDSSPPLRHHPLWKIMIVYFNFYGNKHRKAGAKVVVWDNNRSKLLKGQYVVWEKKVKLRY